MKCKRLENILEEQAFCLSKPPENFMAQMIPSDVVMSLNIHLPFPFYPSQ